MAEGSLGGYELTALLAMAFRTLTDELHLRLAKAGYPDIRPAHGFAFQLLSFQPVSVNDLADHLGITKQASSQMVEYLEQHGYVFRQPQPSDKRGKLVVLTAKGWDCIKQTETIFGDLEQGWTELLGQARMQELRSDLRKLVLQANGGAMPRLLRPSW